jgi:hypothetical protein
MPRWTKEARRKQAEIQRVRQSWRRSTGPRTAAGKARSSRNAVKHGLYTGKYLEFHRVLRLHNRFLRQVKKGIRMVKQQKRAERAALLFNLQNGFQIPENTLETLQKFNFFPLFRPQSLHNSGVE